MPTGYPRAYQTESSGAQIDGRQQERFSIRVCKVIHHFKTSHEISSRRSCDILTACG
jgi:hypothetical protein